MQLNAGQVFGAKTKIELEGGFIIEQGTELVFEITNPQIKHPTDFRFSLRQSPRVFVYLHASELDDLEETGFITD